MRYLLLLLLLFIVNSCNLENGVQRNYIISQMKEGESQSLLPKGRSLNREDQGQPVD